MESDLINIEEVEVKNVEEVEVKNVEEVKEDIKIEIKEKKEVKKRSKKIPIVSDTLVQIEDSENLKQDSNLSDSMTQTLELLKISMIKIEKEIKILNDQNSGHIEIIQKLINSQITSTPSQSTLDWVQPVQVQTQTQTGSNSKKTQLIIKKINDEELKISGKTFDCKDLIKSVVGGAKFSTEDKSWIISIGSLSDIERIFNENNISFISDL